MKINNKKVIVATLALAMGAALAGSISGSVAWYQYSTRAAAQIAGTSAGTEGRLQVKKDGDATDLFSNRVSYSAAQFKPRSVKNEAGVLTFYEKPVYQYPQLQALTSVDGYSKYSLNFRFQTNQANPESWQDNTSKNIYLSHFAIVSTGSVDITPAVRVAFLDSDGKAKFILGSTDAVITTDTKQELDIGGATGKDTSYWDTMDDPAMVTASKASYIEYTTGAENYVTNKHSDVLADVSDPYKIDSATGNSAKILSTTAANNKLDIVVWIEGFAELGSTPSALWDETTIAQSFEIQMQFQCEADK